MVDKTHHGRDAMNSLIDLIAVIKDPEKYEAAITEITDKLDKAQAMVELVAPAKEIDRIRSQCHADKSAAKQLVASATAKAQQISINSSKVIKAAQAGLDARQKTIEDKETAFVKLVAEEKIKSKATSDSLDLRESKADLQYKRGDEMLRKGRDLKDEFEARLKKLREAAS